MRDLNISHLLGKTLVSVENNKNEDITFKTADGATYMLTHIQDCCEHVRVEEVIGDLTDLVGSPILEAEEVTNADGPAPEYPESFTWTFYKLGTNKGSVTLRWLGESNGYYSESVDFIKVRP